MNETIVAILIKISGIFPYRFAKISGNVKTSVSLLIWRAKKRPFNINDKPNPMGNTAPSQKWNLYERSALPKIALLSIDWAPNVMATIHNGKLLPATKKFSASPWTKNNVAKPIKKEITIAITIAIPYPVQSV